MILLRCSLVWLMQCTLLPAPELPPCKEWYMQNCITTSAYVVEWSHSQTNTLTSILWYTDSMTVCYNSTDSMLPYTDSMLQDTDKAWSCGSCKGRRISPYLELSSSERSSLNLGSFLNCSRKASLFRSLSNWPHVHSKSWRKGSRAHTVIHLLPT